MTKAPSLDGAYALQTPDDSIRLYAAWAETYDEDFASTHGYVLHEAVARAYVNAGGYQPVLDVGAGTGLCGAALAARGLTEIDGTDISQEMLEVARSKEIYHTLFAGDILAGLEPPDGHYAGAVSAGTFTHGHVGPEGLDEMMRIVRPGGVLCLSVNAQHYAAQGFAAKLGALEQQCKEIHMTEVAIYEDGAGAHAQDRATIVVMRKL